MRIFLSAIIITLILSSNLWAETAKGICFEDKNNNNFFDDDEVGIANVLVSNGRDIVKTDKDGNYSIPLQPNEVLFVINPAEYEFPRTELGNLSFYYNYFPEGSPKLKFGGVSPTGKFPDFIYFALKKKKLHRNDFTMLFFGDSQVRNETEVGYLVHSSLTKSLEENADLGVFLGDVGFDDLRFYKNLIQSASVSAHPWHYLPGNHDIDYDAANQNDVDDTWNNYFGPSYYSYNYGNVHFISLFDVWYDGNHKYHAKLGEKQLEFIKNDLKYVDKSQLVVLMMHIPMDELKDKQQLFDILKDYPKTLSFAGHTHTNRQIFFGKNDGWQGTKEHHHIIAGATCGSWWDGNLDIYGIPQSLMSDGGSKGYWVVKFENYKYRIKFVATEPQHSDNFSLWSYEKNDRIPELNEYFASKKDSVFINVFGGGKLTNVRVKIDDGEWFKIQQIRALDPFYDQIIFIQKNYAKEENKAVLNYWLSDYDRSTEHIWAFKLPSNLSKGPHTIEVEVRDPNGISEMGKRIIRVE